MGLSNNSGHVCVCVTDIKNHAMLLLFIVIVVPPSLVYTAIMLAITTGIVAPTLAY